MASFDAYFMYIYILVHTQIRGFFGSRYKLFPHQMLVKFFRVIVKFLGRLVLINLLPFRDTSTLSTVISCTIKQPMLFSPLLYISQIHSYHEWRCIPCWWCPCFWIRYVEKSNLLICCTCIVNLFVDASFDQFTRPSRIGETQFEDLIAQSVFVFLNMH